MYGGYKIAEGMLCTVVSQQQRPQRLGAMS